MALNFSNIEKIRIVSSLSETLDRYRKFCEEKDEEFGPLNDIYRDAIHDYKSIIKQICEDLTEQGHDMTRWDYSDKPIDDYIVKD